MESTARPGNDFSWYLSLAASCGACFIAGSILYLGFLDLKEGNAAWLNSGPDFVPKGDVAVRTVWGVTAMLLSPLAFIILFGFVKYRSRFAALSIQNRYLLAIGLPLSLVIVLVALCAISVLFPYPMVIPYPAKP